MLALALLCQCLPICLRKELADQKMGVKHSDPGLPPSQLRMPLTCPCIEIDRRSRANKELVAQWKSACFAHEKFKIQSSALLIQRISGLRKMSLCNFEVAVTAVCPGLNGSPN